jgi:hypothetical protein
MVYTRKIGNKSIYEGAKGVNYLIGDTCSTGATLNASTGVGGLVNLSASTSCPSAEYKFFMQPPGSTTYAEIRNWGEGTLSWTNNTGISGLFSFMVYVRKSGNQSTYESSRSLTYLVGQVCGVMNSFTAVPGEEGVNLVAMASCTGSSASTEYRFFVQPPGNTGFTEIRNWGEGTLSWSNNTGQSGDFTFMVYARNKGNPSNYESSLTKVVPLSVQVPTYTIVSVGRHHNCAQRTDGKVICWGANIHGEAMPPSGPFTAIAPGNRNTCGLRPDGTLAFWGDPVKWEGQPTGTFTAITGSMDYDYIFGDEPGHDALTTCGLRTDGMNICWVPHDSIWNSNCVTGEEIGCGPFIAIALGGPMSTIKPDGTVMTGDPATFTAIASGLGHGCGIHTEGTLACWGGNGKGQATPPSGTFSAISAGDYFSCGIQTDGTLACWGDNTNGQATPPIGHFAHLSSRGDHSCAIKTDGTLACWGGDNAGITTLPTGSFTAITNSLYYHFEQGTGIFAISGCNIKWDGTVSCWGGLKGEALPPSGTYTTIKEVRGGVFFPPGGVTRKGCGIKTDGTLACWNTWKAPIPPLELALGMPVGSGRMDRLPVGGWRIFLTICMVNRLRPRALLPPWRRDMNKIAP